MPAIALVTLNNMQTISTERGSGPDYFYNTAVLHNYSKNMQFLLTDPMSLEISIIQRDKRGKTYLFSQVVLLWQHFLLSQYHCFSCILTFCVYISLFNFLALSHHWWEYRNCHITYMFSDVWGKRWPCQLPVNHSRCNAEGGWRRRGHCREEPPYPASVLGRSDTGTEKRYHSKRHRRGAILKHVRNLNLSTRIILHLIACHVQFFFLLSFIFLQNKCNSTYLTTGK